MLMLCLDGCGEILCSWGRIGCMTGFSWFILEINGRLCEFDVSVLGFKYSDSFFPNYTALTVHPLHVGMCVRHVIAVPFSGMWMWTGFSVSRLQIMQMFCCNNGVCNYYHVIH